MLKFVLRKIEKICRAFLWSDEYSSSKPWYIAWQKVCTPKQAGGLGVRHIMISNKVTLAKYVWVVTTK